MEMGSETGVAIRRYPYKDYTFKNFEIFLYEVLKGLQKSGTNNFQNISDVYLEVSVRSVACDDEDGGGRVNTDMEFRQRPM